MSARRSLIACIAAVASVLGIAQAFALPPLHGATHLAGGAWAVCAALDAGGAACWGDDYNAALGRQTPGRAAGPVEGLDASLASLGVGREHACAVGNDGLLWCWGSNGAGQLGVGTTFDVRGAVRVAALSGVTDVTAGEVHTCAVAGGAVYCWGGNYSGQLGNGTTTSVSSPVAVPGLGAGAQRAAAGGKLEPTGSFSCAVVSGAAWCWGANDRGQLGDGTREQRLLPVPVTGLSAAVTGVAAGRWHACAIQGGAVKCWGANWDGQLGDGFNIDRLTPVSVVNAGAGMLAVAAGGRHTCALRGDGTVLCWGANDYGQLGDGTTDWRYVARPVVGLVAPAVDIALSEYGTCVLLANGTVQCFGRYVLGIGAMPVRSVPVEVGAVAGGIAALSGGGSHTCGTTGAGAALCFGTGHSGQLGMGARRVAPTPAIVPTLPGGVAEVSAGAQHTCARSNGGAALCWGSGGFGRLGNGQASDSDVPVAVVGLQGGAVDIAAGGAFSCAVDAAGAAKCWGSDIEGALGDGGGVQSSTVPVQVAGLASGVTRIAAGQAHACALRAGGGVKCWGSNGRGQIGDGATTYRPAPVDVLGLNAGVVDVAAGGEHTCAVTATGGVLCWGANQQWQLGDGTNFDRLAPVSVSGLSGTAVHVVTGGWHSCALMAGGEVFCWGSNWSGQTGPNGGTAAPAVVPLGMPALAITAGSGHTCAVVGNGRALCWGHSMDSQLGNGDVAQSPVPRFVAVGDFHSDVALASSPNPSRHGEHVTIVARVTAADVVPEGRVSFADSGVPLRCDGTWDSVVLQRGEARCTAPMLVGLHDLRADFDGSTARLLPSFGATQHTVVAVAGQHCAGFDDVDAADPFCTSVEWLRNRNVTFGCRANDYCPNVPVSRLAMAAFMDRLGGVLVPESLLYASSGVLFAPVSQCTIIVPPTTHPRRAIVDAVVSATSDDATELAFETAYVVLAAPYTESAAGPAVRVAMSPTAPTTVRLRGTVDIDAEQEVRVGFRFRGQALPTLLTSAHCIVRAMVFNRDVLHAPFDVPSGDKP